MIFDDEKRDHIQVRPYTGLHAEGSQGRWHVRIHFQKHTVLLRSIRGFTTRRKTCLGSEDFTKKWREPKVIRCLSGEMLHLIFHLPIPWSLRNKSLTHFLDVKTFLEYLVLKIFVLLLFILKYETNIYFVCFLSLAIHPKMKAQFEYYDWCPRRYNRD
jgi:hypothetical protein